jgi:hypothetical protein
VQIKIDGLYNNNYGMFQLELVNADSGKAWITGISIHLTGDNTDYNPVILDSRNYDPDNIAGRVQNAILKWEDEIADTPDRYRGCVILIYPNTDFSETNLAGDHIENLVLADPPVKLQGIGPGGDFPLHSKTRGTVLHGGNFGAGIKCNNILTCETEIQDAWNAIVLRKAGKLETDGGGIDNLGLVSGQVIYVLGGKTTYTNGPTGNGWNNEFYRGGIDGCTITGGLQENLGANPTQVFESPDVVGVQGGGITVSQMIHG